MPNSVLWVCLVAVWLFVLVPMVIKGRPQILKSTDAARKTRLLHRGGSRASTASTARRRSSARHPHDPSWTSRRTATATVEAEADETDTEADESNADTEDSSTRVRRAAADKVEKPTVKASDADDADAEDAELEDDELEDDDVVDADADTEESDTELTGEAEDADSESDEDADAEYEDDQYEDAEYEDATDELDEDEYDDYARSSRQSEQDEAPEVLQSDVDDDHDAADDRGAATRPHRPARRSIYSSEKERELKYRERQRVTLGLFVLVILSIATGVVVGAPGWVATGVMAVMLVGYLAYLRRAVMTEQQIRAQRLARAKRAARAEEERRRRAAAVPEFAAAPPPPRLRRPGGATVLEIDDEDPVFDHLPPFQRRRMDREDLEFRRVG